MSDILKMLENDPELRKKLNTLLSTAKDSEGAGNAGTTAGSSSPAPTAHSAQRIQLSRRWPVM